MADGNVYIGACPRQYCFTRDGKPLKKDKPERGASVDGLILATRVQEEEEEITLVSVPDGAVIPVKAEQIREAPKELSPDVPV